MKSIPTLLFASFIFLFLSCSTDEVTEQVLSDAIISDDVTDNNSESAIYFPPLNSTDWETISTIDLGWNSSAEQDLFDFLTEKNSKSFIILKDGKIAVEWYATDHNQESPWYWASAGKTLTSFTAGIALEEGHFSLTDKSSDYLGTGWTSLSSEKEDLITIWHQLTMTSGMDDTQGDCKIPACLTYIADAGTRWSYHNAPYTLIQEVLANATSVDFETYFTNNLKEKIGMTGQWLSTNGLNNVYWSTARSMARFGLLNLTNGVWNQTTVLGDTDFLTNMKSTSQDYNKSYGYLWWLNGKESSMIPTFQTVFPTELIPNAPDDLYAGLGKDDQKLYIIPSQNLVVIRMGEDTGEPTAGPSSFDNELWEKINAVIN